MPRSFVALLAVGCLGLGAALPAEGADPLLKRVRKLERRVNALAVLEAGNNDLVVTTQTLSMRHVGNGYYEGTVFCVGGETAVGGGVRWPGQFAKDNHIYFSYRDSEFSWKAAVDAGGAATVPQIQVVCADLD